MHLTPAVFLRHAAGNVTVPTSVLNTGNVRLDIVTIPGKGGCVLGTLEPRQLARCNTTVFAVLQDDFEAAQVVATATATASPRGNTTAAVTGELMSSKALALQQIRGLTVSSSASAANVTVAGEAKRMPRGPSTSYAGCYADNHHTMPASCLVPCLHRSPEL
jgi:hypothetical protein